MIRDDTVPVRRKVIKDRGMICEHLREKKLLALCPASSAHPRLPAPNRNPLRPSAHSVSPLISRQWAGLSSSFSRRPPANDWARTGKSWR